MLSKGSGESTYITMVAQLCEACENLARICANLAGFKLAAITDKQDGQIDHLSEKFDQLDSKKIAFQECIVHTPSTLSFSTSWLGIKWSYFIQFLKDI